MTNGRRPPHCPRNQPWPSYVSRRSTGRCADPQACAHHTGKKSSPAGRCMAANLLARGEAQWSLVAQDSENVMPLRSFPCQIGRHPGVPVRVIHPTVSLVHAELRGCVNGLELVDLSSRNGTFVNGKKVLQSQIVHADDLLQFGAAVFRLRMQVQGHTQPSLNATCQSENVGDLAL